ncbi:alpha,alpha-trehalase TreF [Paraburkholderia humisilvae]|uniref:Cytoplasmic trehalase n=1 Tax=Paraburkholderia humisilvae TaxID=627669 RepID=A0A6J5F6L7_9BURK|nr:alpha,alpha-trehalase TreF [Paraburkholderia humisilvae]CAB3774013.1 Cytoplasmic trehalase [Paraburkholderia humisilvae]
MDNFDVRESEAQLQHIRELPLTPSDQYGPLFFHVQSAHIFQDSKSFPDMDPIEEPAVIVSAYEREKHQPGFDLKAFVGDHFTINSPSVSKSDRSSPRSLLTHVHALWDELYREPRKQRIDSSLLALPNPYVVPGGRFDEIYYWDSYFTMLGLGQSGRNGLVRSMLNNIASLIAQYGHVPNGNRTYYLSRSQPPWFAKMVQLVAEMDGDRVYAGYLPQLKREYEYWMNGEAGLPPGEACRRVVRLKDGTLLNRYWDDRATPRDESWREDVGTARRTFARDSGDLWRNLRAGAESGWDFSSRWFEDGQTLGSIETASLLPVDLNCLLFDLECTLAHACGVVGDATNAENFVRRSINRANAIRNYLWDPSLQAFGDYHFARRELTHRLTVATAYPLYMGVATRDQANRVSSTLRSELLREGGLAITLNRTGQQWDFPNGWAPMQYIAVQGLRRYGYRDLACSIAARWIRTNLTYYQHTGLLLTFP